MNDEVLEAIKKCIEEALEHDVDSLSLDDSLTDDLDMQSIHIVTFQVALEDAFQIEFDPLRDDFYEIFRTVSSVYQVVKTKIHEREY